MGFDREVGSIIREERVSTVLQPIVDVGARSVLAYEALTRGPADGALHSPLALFAAATEHDLLPELELVCLKAALRRAATLKYTGRLFLNVSPHSLLAGLDWPTLLAAMCQDTGIDPGACTLELTEQTLVADFDRIRDTLRALREVGFDFAIDDFGTGHSGLRMWSELRPDFVKIDRYFATGIDQDPVKLEFVRSIVDMGRAVGSRVIAEGIETANECRALFELDIDGAQGYLFGRPESSLRDAANILAPLASVEQTDVPATAGDLLVEVTPARPSMKVAELVRLIHERPQWPAIPVVSDTGAPVGMIWRDRFLLTYSKPMHPELLARKPITAIMDPAPLVVDARLRLEQASRLVTRQSHVQPTDQFIIARDGLYAGIGRMIDLLSHITERRIQAATHCNPLTALPGNVPVRDNINRALQQGHPFIAAYVDLDHFKPFNDVYGYAKGDQALLELAQVITSVIARRTDFVGHIGGDDFLVLMRSPDWAIRLVRLVETFSARIRNHYKPADLAREGIDTLDRNGQLRRFGLLTLSVAIVDSRGRSFQTADDVSEALQVAKGRAKQVEGNSLWYDGTYVERNLLEDPALLATLSEPSPGDQAPFLDTGNFDTHCPAAVG